MNSPITIITRPNCSLTLAERLRFFFVMLFLSSVIAVGFAFAGAWLILPFAGLEMIVLGWALYCISCHSSDYECIEINGGSFTVETRDHKNVRRIEFQRYWVQVMVIPASNQGRCRVWVLASGKEVEVGRFVNDDDRMALARQLKLQTGAGYKI